MSYRKERVYKNSSTVQLKLACRSVGVKAVIHFGMVAFVHLNADEESLRFGRNIHWRAWHKWSDAIDLANTMIGQWERGEKIGDGIVYRG